MYSERKNRRHSIKTYIMIWSVGFALVLALAVAGASFVISRRYLQENQRQAAAASMQLLASEISAGLDSTELFVNWICIDTTISDYLKHVIQAGGDEAELRLLRGESVSCWEHLNQEFSTLSIRGLIRRVLVSVPDGSRYLQIIPSYDTVNLASPAEIIMNQPYFSLLLKADHLEYAGLLDSPLSPHYSRKVIPVIRPIYSTTSTQQVGWVYLELSQELVSRSFDNFSLAEDEQLFITIEGAASYRYLDGVFTPSSLPGSVVSCRFPAYSWTVSVLPSGMELSSRSRGYLLVISLIFVLIFMSGLFLATVLKGMITRPVSSLLSKIEKVGKGDFSRDPDIEWDNELGDIGAGINDLSMNVSALMEKKVQDEKTRQELEYRILQSQINPHFMYNTLNTIKWMAAIQGADGIADMSTALSRLLKNIARQSDSLITVKEEFQLLDDYFTIMKYRYAGTIGLEYEIADETLLSQKINRFCVQPIVENAIFHGIEPTGGAGVIRVGLFRIGDDFCISVTDNGTGMTEEEIRRVLSGKETTSNEFLRGMGIANVDQRIRFAFGPSYGIRIESRKGEYTVMRLIFPIQEVCNA